ncbi:MAG TPA: FAD-dependent oxidoreductase [Albitalea sp.]|nr:FAD-dependent oxidoreductase [Albitalea sp.]
MPRRKLLLLIALVLGVAAFFLLDLDRALGLEAIKERQAQLTAAYEQRPLLFIAAYALVYVLSVALSFPGATVLTLVAGAVFGVVAGTLIVSFASSVGALLAFLAARYLLRDSVQRRFGARLDEVDKGIERDGAFYLFALRLVPLVPFFVINLLMGLTRMKAGTFYLVSQVGMLAGTAVYVNAGTQLARIESLRGILSPGVVGSFVLLGVFPLVARKLLDTVRRRKVYARWAHLKPRRFDRNMVVIGAGAAGLVTSYIAAAVKARVTLVESHRMGGDCLHTGCVPSKALIRSAALMHAIRGAPEHGIDTGAPTLRFERAMQRVAQVVREVEPHDSAERYRGLGVEVIHGHATIVHPWAVEIDEGDGRKRTVTTRSIVIAAGAQPIVPDLPGLEETGYLTSDTLWALHELPRRLVVLGGGPIGCELAQALARLGSQVTLVEMLPRLMTREDDEVSALVRQALERDGVQVLAGHRALRCERDGERKAIVVQGEGELRIEFDQLLCAIGRRARLEGYGLEALGIPTGKTIATDEYLQTIYPNILACGDVAGPYQFTHTAAHQAWYAAVNGLFGTLRRFKVDHAVIPWATFVDPEVARVGLSEGEARDKGLAFEVTRFELAELDRAIVDGRTEGFVKVLTVPGRDKILGVTIVGAHAADLLAEYVLAMKHGLGLNKILGTIHTYPTLAEANKYVAGAWKRAHAPQRLLRWVERFHDWRRG